MRLSELIPNSRLALFAQSRVTDEMKQACLSNEDIAGFEVIGKSEQGREILAFILGTGPKKVSLLAGSHADEPVGPATIRLLITEGLKHRTDLNTFFKRFTFYCIPQINPDGEIRNCEWIKKWPDVCEYIAHAARELPGKDIEFGYPKMRPENKAAAEFWKKNAPLNLHISLHGMGFAEGVMLLIERHWTSRTQETRDRYTKLAADMNLGLHIHNRKGEKGFFYIEDGYTTTPEGAAMRAHFIALNDNETAALFHSSSMEYIRSLGGDPLSLVTEIPLFVINHSGHKTMKPENYLRFREMLPTLKSSINKGKLVESELVEYGVRPVDLKDAIRLQLETIELGIEAIL